MLVAGAFVFPVRGRYILRIAFIGDTHMSDNQPTTAPGHTKTPRVQRMIRELHAPSFTPEVDFTQTAADSDQNDQDAVDSTAAVERPRAA